MVALLLMEKLLERILKELIKLNDSTKDLKYDVRQIKDRLASIEDKLSELEVPAEEVEETNKHRLLSDY